MNCSLGIIGNFGRVLRSFGLSGSNRRARWGMKDEDEAITA